MEHDWLQELSGLMQHLRSALEEEKTMQTAIPVSEETYRLYMPKRQTPSPPTPPPPKQTRPSRPPSAPVMPPKKERQVPLQKKPPPSPAFFTLEPPKKEAPPVASLWKDVLARIAPDKALLDPPLPTREKSEKRTAYILLHTQVSVEGMTFLQRVVAAMEERGRPLLLWNIEEKGEEDFEQVGGIKAILATQKALDRLTNTPNHYKHPLLLIDSPEAYCNDPQKKRTLWQLLQTLF